MKLLALDTTMAACSVAVHESGGVLAKAFVAMERGHAEAIAPMVRDVMAETQVAFSALDRIAVTVGPGTFTGVRIGLAMARGLGLALDIPVIGIDTLSAIAANAKAADMPLLVASDARRGEVYAALFDRAGKMLRQPAVMSLQACLQILPEGPVRMLGTAADFLTAAGPRIDLARSVACDLPDAANFGALALQLPDTGAMPVPLYLRAPDAKPQITIRTASGAEAQIFAALHAECFEASWCAEAFSKLMSTPGAAAFLALVVGKPVGFILIRKAAEEAEILTLATRPPARRRGIAGRLLDHQLTELRAQGITTCFIEVASGNEAARTLYQTRGFIEAGRRRGYYERPAGNFEDAIVMRKALVP
ncbi:MAG: tRNA (adenosine(37)-N6)-threonylcarbamoyltransferase complex dimerization subunit type 1 TsaB [Aestuariivirga sp.]